MSIGWKKYSWSTQAKYIASDGISSDQYATGVSIVDTTMYVGIPNKDVSGVNNCGKKVIYTIAYITLCMHAV